MISTTSKKKYYLTHKKNEQVIDAELLYFVTVYSCLSEEFSETKSSCKNVSSIDQQQLTIHLILPDESTPLLRKRPRRFKCQHIQPFLYCKASLLSSITPVCSCNDTRSTKQITESSHPSHGYIPTAEALPSSFRAKELAKIIATAIPTANHFQRQNRCSIFCQTSLKPDLEKKDLIHN